MKRAAAAIPWPAGLYSAEPALSLRGFLPVAFSGWADWVLG